jgi:hypothetical protein
MQYRQEMANRGHQYIPPNEPTGQHHRISSGNDMRNEAEQRQGKNYQTFNEDESGMQHPQYDQMDDDESELSDYPGEEDQSDDVGEDLGETGQLSPTQSSPDRQGNHLQNFMQNA